MRLPTRPPVRAPIKGARRVRAGRRIRLISAGRLAGLATMLLAGLAVYWLASADEFRLDPASVELSGLRFTDEQVARDRLGLAPDDRPNLFRLRTAGMAAAVADLPTVESASVAIALPDRLVVRVVEREPRLAWQTRQGILLVDGGGSFLATVADPPVGLAVVAERRAGMQAIEPGARLDAVDLAAVLRLAAITPQALASSSVGLSLSVDDGDGWVITSAAPAWRAVFGIYTANLRRPEDNIDRQVQCLRSLLAQGERQVEVVYLAVADDLCGTVRERPTPSGHIFQNVGRQATPARDRRA